MAIENGSAFLLKIGDGGAPPAYRTVAGLRTTMVSVSAAGIFTGSDAEVRLRGHALAGTIDDDRLSFESGERMEGRFLVTRLDYSGDYNGERQYVLSLESSGPVVSL